MAKGNAERKFLNHEHTRFGRIALKDQGKPNSPGYVFIHYDEICRIDFHCKILPILPTKDGPADICRNISSRILIPPKEKKDV